MWFHIAFCIATIHLVAKPLPEKLVSDQLTDYKIE